MELAGKVTVVTGGASGIGRSLAVAFAAQGAAAVAVADVDGAGADAVAKEITDQGGTAVAVATDVSDEAQIVSLVSSVEDAFGPIDVFCSNAGILALGGPEAPDALWDRTWGINVMSHVYAARAVLPGMVARGEGYLVHTASAAGLLTQLGALPYSMSKHAVVSLAEWLSITYADAGIKVSCLCPQAVRTNIAGPGVMGEASRGGTLGASTAARDGILEPDDVAQEVIRALAEERFLILPHHEVATYEVRRAEDRERWLRGMRRVQSQLPSS
jgi:NAD(P)-dependent dehydrogenase (short-subunit alcohol dehydrogenase family)